MSSKSPYSIVLRPVVTEDSVRRAQMDTPQYTFEVHPDSTKPEIRWALEKIYNVKVRQVRTLRVKGKIKRVRYRPGRTSLRKKAIVSLAKDQKLEIY